jgi:uncharacterized protein (DUF2235 family)
MKKLICCCDGTWNRPGQLDNGKTVRTNVQKIFEAIEKKDKAGVYQLKYYGAGVGSSGGWLQRIIDGATGSGLDRNIISAYQFLVWNYEPGDQIWLFGFSRGAYTARSLAGLIRNCGILKNNNLQLIQEAYTLYRDRTPGSRPDSDKAKAFVEQNSYTVPRIHCIGVWDTVGSLGIPLSGFRLWNKERYAFHDTTLSSIVDHAYHALAVDETRVNFVPTIWNQSENVKQYNPGQVLEQRWFPGVHSNVGGGYPDEQLSDLALRWMIEKAAAAGLAFDDAFLQQEVAGSPVGQYFESNVFPFSLAGKKQRPIGHKKNGNEKVDASVYERMRLVNSYHPKNLPE